MAPEGGGGHELKFQLTFKGGLSGIYTMAPYELVPLLKRPVYMVEITFSF